MSTRHTPMSAAHAGQARGPVPALLFSDVDGTLLDDCASLREVAAGWRALAGRAEVVLASSRTVEELLDLLDTLGTTADLIAENGACTAVRSIALARELGARETLTWRGQRWYVTCGASSVEAVLATVRRTRDCYAANVVLAAELLLPQRLRLLGGDGHGAQRALTRRASVLAVPPDRSGPNDAWLDALRHAGFHAAFGGRWLTIWCGPDKGLAAGIYLAARRWIGAVPPQVAAVGDAENDVPLLRAVPTRFAVRRRDGGHDPSLLAVPAVIPLASAGYAGWREATRHLLRNSGPMSESVS